MKRWLSLGRAKSVGGGLRPSLPDEVVPTGIGPTSDEELLRKFVVERDDRAFAELVDRHGGMVLGVCRRVLGQAHDAEDAFQAVFLVLARKAETLRRAGSLPAWLHRTAFRTALRARAQRGRRREQATEDLHMIAAAELRDIASDYDRSVVDEELSALPERYRLPIFLCCIEGKSLDVTARQLGWSVGSVKGRLERGRAELRRRLLLRRVPIALGLVAATALAPSTAAASTVSPSLIAATVQAGMQHAVGRSALGYVSQNALTLSRGSWNIMSLTATKIVVGCVTLLGIGVVGAGRLPGPAQAGNGGGLTLEASFTPSGDDEFASQLALADERKDGRRKEGVKDAPREGDAPRKARPEADAPQKARPEGDAPQKPRPESDAPKKVRPESDAPRKVAAERDAPKARPEGDAPKKRSAEGDAPRKVAAEGERGNPADAFQPQTDREEMLIRMIKQLQGEVAELRRIVQAREGGSPKTDAPRKED